MLIIQHALEAFRLESRNTTLVLFLIILKQLYMLKIVHISPNLKKMNHFSSQKQVSLNKYIHFLAKT
jgi:hypothetical protein